MWWTWRSQLWPAWLWHALFDGTIVCPCERSRKWRAAIEANDQAAAPPDGRR